MDKKPDIYDHGVLIELGNLFRCQIFLQLEVTVGSINRDLQILQRILLGEGIKIDQSRTMLVNAVRKWLLWLVIQRSI